MPQSHVCAEGGAPLSHLRVEFLIPEQFIDYPHLFFEAKQNVIYQCEGLCGFSLSFSTFKSLHDHNSPSQNQLGPCPGSVGWILLMTVVCSVSPSRMMPLTLS